MSDAVILSVADLSSVKLVLDGNDHGIELRVRPEAAASLKALTGELIGQPIAILVDGRLQSAPTLVDRMSDSIWISGGYSDEELTALAHRLGSVLQDAGRSSAEAELVGLERAWNEAHVKGDAAALEALWADDLVVTVPRMAALSRADALAMARSGRIKFRKYDSSGVRARVYQDTGLVTGRLERVRERDGRVIADHWLFTKVYRKVGGQWRVIAFHASEAPAP